MNRDHLDSCIVGWVGDEPVACVSLLREDFIPRPEFSPFVASVYVVPSYRGCGYGKDVLKAAENHARNLGLGVVHLWTTDHRRFYEALGWDWVENIEVVGRRADVLRKNVALCKNGVANMRLPTPVLPKASARG